MPSRPATRTPVSHPGHPTLPLPSSAGAQLEAQSAQRRAESAQRRAEAGLHDAEAQVEEMQGRYDADLRGLIEMRLELAEAKDRIGELEELLRQAGAGGGKSRK